MAKFSVYHLLLFVAGFAAAGGTMQMSGILKRSRKVVRFDEAMAPHMESITMSIGEQAIFIIWLGSLISIALIAVYEGTTVVDLVSAGSRRITLTAILMLLAFFVWLGSRPY